MEEHKTLRENAAARIKSIAPDVASQVTEIMVQREVKKRVEQLVKAIDDLTLAEREMFKLKADIQSFDIDGKVISEAYSKDRIEARRKQAEKIEKMQNGINKALSGDFSKLVQGNARGDSPGDD